MTSSPPVIKIEDPSFQTSHEAGDETNYLSQDTLEDHFGSTGGPLSHAQRHTRDKYPMDVFVIAGNN